MVSAGSLANIGLAAGIIYAGYLALTNAGKIGSFIGGGLNQFGSNIVGSITSGFADNKTVDAAQGAAAAATDPIGTILDAQAAQQTGAQNPKNVTEGIFNTPNPNHAGPRFKFSIPQLNMNSLARVSGRITSQTPFEVANRFPTGNLPQFVTDVEFRQNRRDPATVSAINLRGNTVRVSEASAERLRARGYLN